MSPGVHSLALYLTTLERKFLGLQAILGSERVELGAGLIGDLANRATCTASLTAPADTALRLNESKYVQLALVWLFPSCWTYHPCTV